MKHHHGWNIPEIEEMIPYERDLYVNMIVEYNKEIKEKQRREMNG